MAKPLTKREEYELLRTQLRMERESFISHYREIGDHLLPRRLRISVSDVNKGDRRNNKIIDSTATLSLRTLRSGMMSGITSPARPWFRLTTPDPEMAEFGRVKDWLHLVSQRMTTVFLRSNLYNTLPVLYGDIGGFGTGAMGVEEDFDSVLRCMSFPIGSYMIAKDYRGKVNVFFREFRMTVRQLVEQFGERDPQTNEICWDNFSVHVRNLWQDGARETWIDVCHVIAPNPEFDPNRLHSKYKRFASCYYEAGTMGGEKSNYMSSDPGRILRESGYNYFPVLVPRWEVSGEDVYGTDCPGMASLGDIKALQLMQKRKSQGIEKMVNPPMVGPSTLKTTKASILPGDITYTDERDGQKGFRPAHEVNIRLSELREDIQDHQDRIRRSFFEDLFLMLSQSDRRDITAREIEERHEEKLLALGPVLEQLNQDVLDPLIDLTFDFMMEQGMIPPPPPELEGVPLRVEYISIMAQAQKLVGIAGVERFASFVGQLQAATGDPAVMDKVDVDQMIDVYGDLTSVPPGIIRPDEAVASIRQSRARAQQAQAAATMVREGAGAARDLSQADMSGDNALTRMIKEANAGALAPA